MTRQLDTAQTTEQRQAGHAKRISRLERRMQVPDGSALGAIASLASQAGSLVTVTANNAFHQVSQQDGVNATFDTSDDTVFANAANGGGIYGIKVLKAPCTIRFEFDCLIVGGTAAAKADAYQVTDHGVLSFWQFGRTAILLGDTWDQNATNHISWIERVSFDTGDVPSVTVVENKIASGANPTVNWKVFAVWETGVYLPNI